MGGARDLHVGYRRARRAMKILAYEFARLRGDMVSAVKAVTRREDFRDTVERYLWRYVEEMARPVCHYVGLEPDGAECLEFKRRLLRDCIAIMIDVDVVLALNSDMLRDILNEAIRKART